MQRLLRIVLFITFMLLIILWFSTIFNTCNKEEDTTSNTENIAAESDSSDVFQDLDDELFEDDQDLFTEGERTTENVSSDPPSSTPDDIFETDNSESYTDYTGTPEKTVEKVTPKNSVQENANYLVVAGSFLIKENAVKMQRKLNGMGYTSEVRNFNYSQYHSVIAGRYNVKSQADRVAAELKSGGISCYVHKRQP